MLFGLAIDCLEWMRSTHYVYWVGLMNDIKSHYILVLIRHIIVTLFFHFFIVTFSSRPTGQSVYFCLDSFYWVV